MEKIKYNTAKLLYGAYPPHSSLNYIWANKIHAGSVLTNSYTDRALMLPVEMGSEHIGSWREYDVNLLEDYQRAFGKNPPPFARIAVMSDSLGDLLDPSQTSMKWVRASRLKAAA